MNLTWMGNIIVIGTPLQLWCGLVTLPVVLLTSLTVFMCCGLVMSSFKISSIANPTVIGLFNRTHWHAFCSMLRSLMIWACQNWADSRPWPFFFGGGLQMRHRLTQFITCSFGFLKGYLWRAIVSHFCTSDHRLILARFSCCVIITQQYLMLVMVFEWLNLW